MLICKFHLILEQVVQKVHGSFKCLFICVYCMSLIPLPGPKGKLSRSWSELEKRERKRRIGLDAKKRLKVVELGLK